MLIYEYRGKGVVGQAVLIVKASNQNEAWSLLDVWTRRHELDVSTFRLERICTSFIVHEDTGDA